MSEKVLPGGRWMKVPGEFRKQALTNCEREQQRTHKGKCQRRFFQGVTGGHFQESSISECLPAVNVNNNTQKGNVREFSSRGSLEVGSLKV